MLKKQIVTLETKKNNILKIIRSINNDAVIDEIGNKVAEVLSKGSFLDSYEGLIEDKIDLQKLSEEQNYQGINLTEMKSLSKEIGIKETTAQLIKMID